MNVLIIFVRFQSLIRFCKVCFFNIFFVFVKKLKTTERKMGNTMSPCMRQISYNGNATISIITNNNLSTTVNCITLVQADLINP